MKIGVTGTREGANKVQLDLAKDFLSKLGSDNELHHGDCSGVDVEIAAIVKELGWRIVCHPPYSTESQGFFGGDEVRAPKGYLERDRNIVDESELLIVIPLQNTWQPRGGTWYTHDYAKKTGKPCVVFYPDGRIEPFLNNK